MKIFTTLFFLFCFFMFGYYQWIDKTHEMIFWGIITLVNLDTFNKAVRNNE